MKNEIPVSGNLQCLHTVNHLQQPASSFILKSFVCFYLKCKYGCNMSRSKLTPKLTPKHLEATKRKKNSSVLCKDEHSFANWPLGRSAGLPGPPSLSEHTLLSEDALSATQQPLLCQHRAFQLLSPKSPVGSQYKP